MRRPRPGRANRLHDHRPAHQRAEAEPHHGDGGIRAFGARVAARSPAAHALGVGGADVVLAEHLEHARAHHARGEGHLDEAERDRGQDHVAEERPEAVAERPELAHGQPAQLDAEREHQEQAEPEGRDREAGQRQRHRRLVEPGVRAQRGEQAERDGERDGEDLRRDRQRDRRLEPLEDGRGDRTAEKDRLPEVGVRQPAQIAAELNGEGLIEAEILPGPLDLLAGGIVARQEGRGVTRRQAKEHEPTTATTSTTGSRWPDAGRCSSSLLAVEPDSK